jgi:hypothetical protein
VFSSGARTLGIRPWWSSTQPQSKW